jgi:2-oxoglutarate ferredoxin oxidoreductase subunit beta
MSCADCNPKISDYHSPELFTWCTNCGNYGINAATKRALVELEIKPKDAMMIFDIGCNGNGADKIGGYRFHGLHGRAVPFASGVCLANTDLTVIASAGDGALISEGIAHLIHAVRSNYNFTLLIHNNSNYALTTGQASATTRQGVPMSASPDGVSADTINILELVLSLNPSFVARTFSGDVHQMTSIFKEGIKHNGLSVIEILQYCPTYSKETTHNWFMDRIYDTITIPNYNNQDLEWARKVAADLDQKIATGIIYHQPGKPSFIDRQANRVKYNTTLVEEVEPLNIEPLLAQFR